MERFVIKGGQKLKGTIRVKGAKNAALKILAACLLSDKKWTVSNVPQIEDVFRQLELLEGLGVEVKNRTEGVYQLRAKNIQTTNLEPNIAQKSPKDLELSIWIVLLIKHYQPRIPNF